MADAQETVAPRVFREPVIPTATEFDGVAQVRAVIHLLDYGNFRQPALLIERMLWNPRLRAVLETRLNGLLATKIRFEPIRNNRDARRAAREYAEDWPTMAPGPMRKQYMRWALLLGVAFAQRAFAESPTSGRQLFRLRPYWPGFGFWYWSTGCYKIQTFDRGVVDVPSPTLTDEAMPASSPWMVAEPFGMNSYRDGLLHAAWRPLLGHDWSTRDQARASEKRGVGILKAIIPHGSGDEYKASLARYMAALRNLGSEGVLPCEERDDENGKLKFDAQPFEWGTSGDNAIDSTITTCAVALAILFLGHNLTTEVKSGGSYAAAGVGEYIRDDVKVHDSEAEDATLGPQLARPYCLLNYQDPELAPRAIYQTDSTAINQAMATMYQQLSMAIGQLQQYASGVVDIPSLCERFRLPLAMLEGKMTVDMGQPHPPAPAPAPTPAVQPKEPTP
jgi:hypothetical protein